MNAFYLNSENLKTTAPEILKLDLDQERLRSAGVHAESSDTNKSDEAELLDSIQSKSDSQKDNLIANLLMNKYSEKVWMRMNEQDRQSKILKARLELAKNGKQSTSDDAKFLLGQFEKNKDLQKQLKSGYDERLKKLIETRKNAVNQGKLSESDAENQFKLDKFELDEAAKPENVLKLLQFDADLEKRKLLDRFEGLNTAQEIEKQRQLELAKQKLARLNAKKDATESAVFELLAGQGAQKRSVEEERVRQKNLARSRLEMYRNNKADLDRLASKIGDAQEDAEMEKIDDYPSAIIDLVDVWQNQEIKNLLRVLDQDQNDMIRKLYRAFENIDLTFWRNFNSEFSKLSRETSQK